MLLEPSPDCGTNSLCWLANWIWCAKTCHKCQMAICISCNLSQCLLTCPAHPQMFVVQEQQPQCCCPTQHNKLQQDLNIYGIVSTVKPTCPCQLQKNDVDVKCHDDPILFYTPTWWSNPFCPGVDRETNYMIQMPGSMHTYPAMKLCPGSDQWCNTLRIIAI